MTAKIEVSCLELSGMFYPRSNGAKEGSKILLPPSRKKVAFGYFSILKNQILGKSIRLLESNRQIWL
jgi:hypothetical protein